jgi:hypothetical protein
MKDQNPFLQQGYDPAAPARDAEFTDHPNGPPKEKAAPSPKAKDGVNDKQAQHKAAERQRKAEIKAATAPGEVESQSEIEALALLCQHGVPALGEVAISSAMFSTPAQRTLWRAMENSARKTPDGKPDMSEVRQATLTASLPADITKDEVRSLVTTALTAAPNPAHAATTLGRVASAFRRRERIGKLERLMRIETGETSGDAVTLLEELNALHGPPNGRGSAPFPDFPDAALYGPAGDFVREIAPLTEAHPAALLASVLGGIGSILGRDAFFSAGGTPHYPNLFFATVGATGAGRKGTAWATVKPLLAEIAPDWLNDCICKGMASGEALIHRLRDERKEREQDKKTGAWEEKLIDKGVADKRLLWIEPELARIFAVCYRPGSILGPLMREAWDGGDLEHCGKQSPEKASGAHVSVIGHITSDELRRLMKETDFYNGGGNRYLWIATRRTQCLPDTPAIPRDILERHARRIEANLERLEKSAAAFPLEIKRDADASGIWNQCYRTLSDFEEKRKGKIGAVLGRAEAQVARVSLLYAALDGEALIRPAHHAAAMELWAYSEASAKWIFGAQDELHPDAARIFREINSTCGAGLTTTEVSGIFNGNRSASELHKHLKTLEGCGLIFPSEERTTGRTATRWIAC